MLRAVGGRHAPQVKQVCVCSGIAQSEDPEEDTYLGVYEISLVKILMGHNVAGGV
jgi:hypothetical protein